DRGLDPALSALAARSPIPVALDVDLSADEGPALDREREAVAYFVVAEALTNIAKHAAATRAAIAVTRSARRLHVRVRDDGRRGGRAGPTGSGPSGAAWSSPARREAAPSCAPRSP